MGFCHSSLSRAGAGTSGGWRRGAPPPKPRGDGVAELRLAPRWAERQVVVQVAGSCLAPSAGPLAMAPLGNSNADQGRLEGGARGGEVGALDVARLEDLLGLLPRFLGSLQMDLGRHVGRLGHHDDLVRQDLEEAADDREVLVLAAFPQPKLAGPER